MSIENSEISASFYCFKLSNYYLNVTPSGISSLVRELLICVESLEISQNFIFGDIECSDSYLNSKRLFLEKIGDLKKSKLQPDMIFPETFINGKIPQKHYKFKPENSLILKFDGLETKKLFDRFSIIK